MPLARWWPQVTALPGSPSAGVIDVEADGWVAAANDVAAAGGQLLSLWATRGTGTDGPATVRAALLVDGRLLVIALRIRAASGRYPGLQGVFPAAPPLQRAAFDLTGVRSDQDDRSHRRLSSNCIFLPAQTLQSLLLSPRTIDGREGHTDISFPANDPQQSLCQEPRLLSLENPIVVESSGDILRASEKISQQIVIVAKDAFPRKREC